MRRAAVPYRVLLAAAATLALLAAACGGGVADEPLPEAPARIIVPPSVGTVLPEAADADDLPEGAVLLDPTTLPPLERSNSIVPIEEVYFDTFNGGSQPLSVASDELIASLRDAIPPLYTATYEDVSGGDWLEDGDLVIGYTGESGAAFAYPHKILNFHEIVNEVIDGVPVLISYCPLCRSGVVYDRRLNGRELIFGNTSALFESDLVMFDWQTNSYWWQVPGRAIVGALAGQQLTPLPSETMTWASWKALYPETVVLSRRTGYIRPYERDPFEGLAAMIDRGRTVFPTSKFTDTQLNPGAEVLGVVVDGEHRVYPLERLGTAAINDEIGGRAVAIFIDHQRRSGVAYFARSGDRALSFELRDGRYVDRETGSVWSFAGEAIEGPLTGERLDAPPSRTTFWFAYLGAFPEAELFSAS